MFPRADVATCRWHSMQHSPWPRGDSCGRGPVGVDGPCEGQVGVEHGVAVPRRLHRQGGGGVEQAQAVRGGCRPLTGRVDAATGEHGGVAGGAHNPLESTMRDTCREHLRTSLQVLRQITPNSHHNKTRQASIQPNATACWQEGRCGRGILGKDMNDLPVKALTHARHDR